MPWGPGQSGNPKGNTPEDRKLKLLARQHTEKAVAKIVSFLDSDNPMVVLTAAKELLDRGYGKAKQVVEGKFEHEHTVDTGSELGIAERVERAKKARTDASIQ